ncbi:Ig-like domain-containing protein [Campylobacter concisus]|uniref:Ig-like domain-containing protein n=1 Tax=Campylobacter concisus TaxID=199 RepID=UPI001958343F|nr:Ig-like domain-containing protein [Campylobacter concisus]VTX99349.1 Bacterial Ig-like domain (group 3) [Campylobacter concisus]
MSKIKGLIKSIIGTDAIVAIDANGNQRTLKAGDVIYDNEVIKEQDGVKVEVQAVQTQNENASDETGKEIASLQEQLLNGKNISDLEETAAGGTQSAGGVSSNGVSLGAAGFANGGHESNINANFGDLSSQANASAEAFTNVSGGASEEGFSLDTLAAAIDNAYNNILPQPLEVSVTAVDDNVVTGNTDQTVSSNLDIEGNILEHENSQRTGLHITNDNTPTLVGKATANSTISIFDGEGENAPLLGTTTADNDGNWSYTPTSPLADGDHKFTIEASKVAANGEELKATSKQEITVDTDNSTLSITKISTDDFSDLSHYNTMYDSNKEYDFSPTIEGKAEPFAEINLVITKAEVIYNTFDYSWVEKPAHVVEKLSAKADAEGNWRAESSVLDTLDTNEYTVQASSVDEAGNKYSEPQATTFYMPLEPITVAPTDHL